MSEVTDNKSIGKVAYKKEEIIKMKTASVGAKLIKGADKISNLLTMAKDPPVDWSKEYVFGYLVWCYAVYLQIMGTNSKIDMILEKIFESHNMLGMTEGQIYHHLEYFYSICK